MQLINNSQNLGMPGEERFLHDPPDDPPRVHDILHRSTLISL